MYPQILKLNVAGVPVRWVRWQDAAVLYARNRVRWEAGEERLRVHGGINRHGERSHMDICSIIAVDERVSRRASGPPPLTNRLLFQRDGYRCMYCGRKAGASGLSRDHVLPTSRGGQDVWTNVVTACAGPQGCNARKDDKLPHEFKPLLAVPYEPNPAEFLLLAASGRRILADQQRFLEGLSERWKRAH